MVRVFVTRALPIDPAALAPPGVTVSVSPHDRPLAADEIVAMAAEAEGIVSMLSDPFDAALLARLPRLRALSNYAVGVNNIDRAAAAARGIVVCNTPDVLTEATADLAWLLVLAVTRRFREAERVLRTGGYDGWSPTLLLGAGLAGRTIGLLGFGRIGRSVARRAAASGMRVLSTTRHPVDVDPALASPVDRETLFAASDVLSLHAPLTPETHHVVDAAALARMKRNAVLVNTSRGPLVDEAALVEALEARRIAGAGLDVFEHEPAVHPGLLGRDDVVLLPHVGSATEEARRAMAELALRGCFDALAGHEPPNRVQPDTVPALASGMRGREQ